MGLATQIMFLVTEIMILMTKFKNLALEFMTQVGIFMMGMAEIIAFCLQPTPQATQGTHRTAQVIKPHPRPTAFAEPSENFPGKIST